MSVGSCSCDICHMYSIIAELYAKLFDNKERRRTRPEDPPVRMGVATLPPI